MVSVSAFVFFLFFPVWVLTKQLQEAPIENFAGNFRQSPILKEFLLRCNICSTATILNSGEIACPSTYVVIVRLANSECDGLLAGSEIMNSEISKTDKLITNDSCRSIKHFNMSFKDHTGSKKAFFW